MNCGCQSPIVFGHIMCTAPMPGRPGVHHRGWCCAECPCTCHRPLSWTQTEAVSWRLVLPA